ncbi:hypothetical protein As57867_003335, partial [Aphanomyces stellatus]
VAVNCDSGKLSEELQVYLYARQIIPFQRSILKMTRQLDMFEFDFDTDTVSQALRSLLDGLRDEVELHRLGKRRNPNGTSSNLTKSVLGMSSRMITSMTPRKPKSHTVFVSHGVCHVDFVRKLRVNLRETGVSVHVDSYNNVSDLKERVIAAKDAILQCQLFLVVLSSEAF